MSNSFSEEQKVEIRAKALAMLKRGVAITFESAVDQFMAELTPPAIHPSVSVQFPNGTIIGGGKDDRSDGVVLIPAPTVMKMACDVLDANCTASFYSEACDEMEAKIADYTRNGPSDE